VSRRRWAVLAAAAIVLALAGVGAAGWHFSAAVQVPDHSPWEPPFQLPILLMHGTEDDLIPISTSDDFAALLPRWVTYFRVPRAGHTQAWNVNPPLYERRLAAFLRRVVP
jgi:pimeloyl-ACP methyl ester carboxylesterase